MKGMRQALPEQQQRGLACCILMYSPEAAAYAMLLATGRPWDLHSDTTSKSHGTLFSTDMKAQCASGVKEIAWKAARLLLITSQRAPSS